MNLKSVSDEILLNETDRLVQQERELLIEILRHLREIERRRLFSSLGYKSLFDYAVRRLKYSEDQAGRRIAAMRLMQEIPEIEEKIEAGALTLTNLGLAQSLFRQETKTQAISKEEKIRVLSRLENASKREAEKIVLSASSDPVALKPDQVRVVTDSKVEIKFIADQALMEKIEKLKGLLAHSHPDISLAELVDKLCDIGLSRLDPASKFTAKKKSPALARRKSDTVSAPISSRKATRRRLAYRPSISTAVRQEVWQRANGQCQNCGSRHALQLDHIKPVSLGGGNDSENLRLLCRSCNLRAAIEKLGQAKISRHLATG